MVEPGTAKTLTGMPVGTLRYEVIADRWGLVDRQTISLSAGETFRAGGESLNVDK